MAAGARYVGAIFVLGLLAGPSATAQESAAAPPDQGIPRAQLEPIYRHELEGLYQPADADKVFAAHGLIEQYFAATTAAVRKKLVQDLEATGLDVNLLGRLCRVRMNWPALQPGGVYYVNERFGPHTVRYFVGVPAAYDRTRPWPLVVKLPGAHAFTTTPPPAGDQAADIYRGWAEEEL